MCSIGPIISVLILGIIYNPGEVTPTPVIIPDIVTTQDAASYFVTAFPEYFKEVAIALAPIAGLFFLFELITKRFKKHQLIRVISGFVYTYLGLVLFLTGVNVGFMPVGHLLGEKIAGSEITKWLLIPVGMLVGYFIVAAEPAVHVLKKNVEEVSNGSISQRTMGIALSVGVSVSVGIAMLRVLTGIPILPILIVGYTIPLVITYFVPPIYTGIAFDSGGVASGPMATTFILPFAIGACEAMGGNVLTDAFGVVAMIAITPLITIQVLGLIGKTKRDKKMRQIHSELGQISDGIVYHDEVEVKSRGKK
jgi:hypothetical protein